MRVLKLVLFWIIQLIVALGMLEVICHVFLKTSSNPLYRARRILQQNESWGWQARPNLDTEFENAPVFTDLNGFRVENSAESVDLQKVELLTLGPSSAFGWGVKAEETYTSKIAKALQLKYLNASQIGFSTEQGLLLWNLFFKEKLPNLKYVIISYGINDLDRFRFYGLSFTDDISYFADGLNRPRDLSLNSSLLTTFNLFENEALLNLNCTALSSMKQRLSLSESKQESLRLIKNLKEKNVKIIFVGTPYLKMPVNNEFQYSDVNTYYEKSQTAATGGHCREALSLLKEAKALEPWRVEQDVVKLAEAQKQLCDEEGILCIDAYTAFDRLKAQKEYFVDPVHPSQKGHDLIARLVLEKLN